MATTSTALPSPIGESNINGRDSHPHLSTNMPRFHPIAMNPNTTSSPTPSMPAPYRPYGAPLMESQHPPAPGQQPQHTQHPPPPPHHLHQHHPPLHPQNQPHHANTLPPPPGMSATQSIPSQLEHIENRLRQIEHEEATRAAARAHLLAVRRREDEEFRMLTERAEAEEEDLRRHRKRLKRESMGLMYDPADDSPPNPAPRRLSETSAATTLAFFKQQSPPQARPMVAPLPMQHPTLINAPTNSEGGTFRKKQKYTIKNVEAWGERHGRPAKCDQNGRALWKRPSDGRLVYLDCPAPGCGKSDFVTLHGFMCHLTKKHKDRSLGSQSRALDLCGTVYDPNAPLPRSRPSLKRAHTDDSQQDSTTDGYRQYPMEPSSSDEEGEEGSPYPVKEESGAKPVSGEPEPHPAHPFPTPGEESSPRIPGSLKPTIATMLDSSVERESKQQPMPTPPMESGHSSALGTTNGTSEDKNEKETQASTS